MLSDVDVGRLGALLRSGRIVRTGLADQSGVMVDTAGMQMLSLNETGMILVEEIASGAGLDALVERLVREFRVSGDTARQDVERFLGELMGFVSAQESGESESAR